MVHYGDDSPEAAATLAQHDQQNSDYARMVDGIAGSAGGSTQQQLKTTDDDANNIIMAPAEDSHTRSIVKGLTWRFTATATTTVIALLITGEVEAALQIGLFEFLAKLFLYYLHERVWTRIRL